MALMRTATVVSISEMYQDNDKMISIFTMSLNQKDCTSMNIVDLYRDTLMEDAIEISFKEDDIDEFDKNPRHLSKVLFGTTDLSFIITLLNDFKEVTEMNLREGVKVYVPSSNGMDFLKRSFISMKKLITDTDYFTAN